MIVFRHIAAVAILVLGLSLPACAQARCPQLNLEQASAGDYPDSSVWDIAATAEVARLLVAEDGGGRWLDVTVVTALRGDIEAGETVVARTAAGIQAQHVSRGNVVMLLGRRSAAHILDLAPCEPQVLQEHR